MFVETVDLPRQEWERRQELLRYTTDPPEALVATIADFYPERVGPVVATAGEPTNKPQRHGEPLALYLRR